MDNIIFYLLNRPKKKNQIVIFDRFICATQIKFLACNYNAWWFKRLWWNIKPQNAIIFIVDIGESINRQIKRNDIYAWGKKQLVLERVLYVQYAKDHNFPIINTTTNTPEMTFEHVKRVIDSIRQ